MDKFLSGNQNNFLLSRSSQSSDSPSPGSQLTITRVFPPRHSPMPPLAPLHMLHPPTSDFERSQSWPSIDRFNQDSQRNSFLSQNLTTPPPLNHSTSVMPSVSPRSFASDIDEPSSILKYGIISRAASVMQSSRHIGIEHPKKSNDFLFPSPKERPPSAFSPRAFSPGGFSVASPFSPSGGFSPGSFSPGSIAETYYYGAASKHGTELEEQTVPLKLKVSPKRELDFSDPDDQPRDLRKHSFSENWTPSPVNPTNESSVPSPKFPYGVRLPPKKARYGYNGPNRSPSSTSSSTSDRHELMKLDSPAPLPVPLPASPVSLRILRTTDQPIQWAESQLNQESDDLPPVQMLPDFAPPSKVLHHHATPTKCAEENWHNDSERYFTQTSNLQSSSHLWSSQYLPPTHVEQSNPVLSRSEVFQSPSQTSSTTNCQEKLVNEHSKVDTPRPKRGRPKKMIQVDPGANQGSPQKKRGKKKSDSHASGNEDDGPSSPVPQMKFVPTTMIRAGKFEISKNILDLILSKKKLVMFSLYFIYRSESNFFFGHGKHSKYSMACMNNLI
ncbi:hypothetical protein QYM36_009738 [Artemia franciscana]|uniref:Uncharacterized protein n=1 Tax=Artemia franciscana TaxID=6661 RepID=A0AA88I264_ARTSF|nr:hypothetical protein QYM36_009738 [Artemia franciscana]